MGLSTPPDLFVLLHPRHFASVESCVRFLQTRLNPSGSRICIVTAALPGDLRLRLDALGCVYLHEADVLEMDATAIPGGTSVFVQLLKWELRRFASTPTYLVVNANADLHATAEIITSGQPVLFCENRFRFGWLLCFNYFFGQYPIPASPAHGSVCHFDRAVLDEMIAKIQGWWNSTWIQACVAIVQQVQGAMFDAADIFGHYLHLFHAERFIKNETLAAREQSSLPNPVVRMGTLGYNGRFANQIFQFAFIQSYAHRHGLRVECPPWIGCSLFGHQSEISQSTLPVYREDKGDTESMIRFDSSRRYSNFELWGYFQNPQHWADNPAAFRNLFQPLPFLCQPLDAAINRIKGHNQTVVAIHLRRGDFNGGPVFWPAPEEWYLQWLDAIWPTLDRPMLYVATDDAQNVLPRFARYQPKTAIDLNVTVNGAEYYSDFYVLSQSDVLGISNSTFSYAAAMLNQKAQLFARPEPDLEKMICFDPWKSAVQLRKSERLAIAA